MAPSSKEFLYGLNPAFEALRAKRRTIYSAFLSDVSARPGGDPAEALLNAETKAKRALTALVRTRRAHRYAARARRTACALAPCGFSREAARRAHRSGPA